jgi:hypothetical protein
VTGYLVLFAKAVKAGSLSSANWHRLGRFAEIVECLYMILWSVLLVAYLQDGDVSSRLNGSNGHQYSDARLRLNPLQTVVAKRHAATVVMLDTVRRRQNHVAGDQYPLPPVPRQLDGSHLDTREVEKSV